MQNLRCAGSDKCIPEKWHCDQYEDCPDKSDEQDCIFDDDIKSSTPKYVNARVYAFAQEQSPNSPTR